MTTDLHYKVSVIVPVYNVEQYLSACLESVCCQTLKDIEIIVVNDGSTDNSLSIIQFFQRKYSNIKLINKENGGLSSARNAGIDAATGEYLFFLDSDDFIDLNALEEMYKKAEETHCPLIICGILLYWSERKNRLYKKELSDKKGLYGADTLYELMLSGKMGCQCCNKLYKRDIWMSHLLRFKEGDYYEDIEVAFKVVREYRQAYVMNAPYYKYRMRPGSIVTLPDKKKIGDFINNTNAAVAIAERELGSGYYSYIEAFRMNAFIYAIKLLNKSRQGILLYNDLCKNIDIRLWSVLLNSKLSLKNIIQYIWYVKVVFNYKLVKNRK